VAFFLSSLSGGGVERNTLTLAASLIDLGYAVDLVVCHPRGALCDQVPEQARVVSLRPSGVLRARARVLTAYPGPAAELLRPVLLPLKASTKIRYLDDLAAYLRSRRPDVLVSAMTWPNLVAVWARRLAGVDTRVVVSERNTLSAYVAHFQRRWRWRHLPALVHRTYPEADAIVAVADRVGADLAETARLERASVRTLYNPVVTPDVDRQAAAPLEHCWFAEGAPPVVLGVGSLAARKDFATLLRAFALLREQREARLVVLGEGDGRQELLALARELGIEGDVQLPGWVPNPFAYMARAGLFVLSSAWEGLPGVLIQALACGCPVVSTDCPGGAAEILEGGALGPLVPVGDPGSMAAAMASVLGGPPEPERLRQRGRDFSVERATGRYVELFAGMSS